MNVYMAKFNVKTHKANGASQEVATETCSNERLRVPSPVSRTVQGGKEYVNIIRTPTNWPG